MDARLSRKVGWPLFFVSEKWSFTPIESLLTKTTIQMMKQVEIGEEHSPSFGFMRASWGVHSDWQLFPQKKSSPFLVHWSGWSDHLFSCRSKGETEFGQAAFWVFMSVSLAPTVTFIKTSSHFKIVDSSVSFVQIAMVSTVWVTWSCLKDPDSYAAKLSISDVNSKHLIRNIWKLWLKKVKKNTTKTQNRTESIITAAMKCVH